VAAQRAITVVARASWRARWRQQLLLAAAVALVVGVVLAVVSGAEQTSTAMDRLHAQTNASDVVVYAGDQNPAALREIVAETPGVIATSVVREFFVRPKGSELYPTYNLLTLASVGLPDKLPVDVPVIVEGRAADERRVDEITVSEALASDLALRVGDRLVLESMTSAWVDKAFNGSDPGPPDGPQVEVVLVGLARTPADFGRYSGVLHLTAAFADRYQDQVRSYNVVAATLTDAKRTQLAAGGELTTVGSASLEFRPSPYERSKAVQGSLDTISTALLLVAGTVGFAGLALIGLLITRIVRDTAADRSTLVSIGWTNAGVVRLSLLVPVPALVIGLVVGLLAGVVGSPLASIGFAAAVDPASSAPVFRFGLLSAVALGVAALLGALLALAAMSAGRATSATRSTVPPAPSLQPPLAVALGVRRALFGSAAGGGRLSRVAAATTVAGIAVTVAALVIGSSIQRLQDDPALSGRGPASQRLLDAGEDADVYERAMTEMEADARAVNLLGFHITYVVAPPAATVMTVLVMDGRRGTPPASLLRGRVPTQPDEVALGPASLQSAGLRVGDEIELQSLSGSGRYRIVGVMLFPEGDFNYDSGVAMTVGGAEFLGGVEATSIHGIVFQWEPSVDAVAADAALVERGFTVQRTEQGLVPPVVSNLGEVRSLAPLVAGLVFVLVLVTVLYTVAMTGRLRRRETGTLRALGATPRVLAATTEVHALALGVAGLALGIPLGVVGGDLVWSQIAARAFVVDQPVIGIGSVGWLFATATIGLAVLAAPLAFSEVRRRSSLTLRSE